MSYRDSVRIRSDFPRQIIVILPKHTKRLHSFCAKPQNEKISKYLLANCRRMRYYVEGLSFSQSSSLASRATEQGRCERPCPGYPNIRRAALFGYVQTRPPKRITTIRAEPHLNVKAIFSPP